MRKNLLRCFLVVWMVVLMAGCGEGEKRKEYSPDYLPETAKTGNGLGEGSEDRTDDASGETFDGPEAAHPKTIYLCHMGSPYLFVKEDGFLHPEEPLTYHELETALSILYGYKNGGRENADYDADDGAATRDADASVLKSDLERVLQEIHVYDEEICEECLPGLSEDDTVSRGQFAALVYRSNLEGKGIKFMDFPAIPSDIDLKSEEAEVLLTASLSYEVIEEADQPNNQPEDWTKDHSEDAIMDCLWTEGDHLLHGYLYRVENGHPLMDATRESHLRFGSDGRFTSGNEELDGVVSEQIWSFQQEMPDATQEDLLHMAFDFCLYNIHYVGRECPEFGDNCNDAWYIDAALSGIDSMSGNCYVYGAALCAMARGCGLDAHCIAGLALDGSDHCWVVIYWEREDGSVEELFYDPQMRQHAFFGPEVHHGLDMFGISPALRDWWGYTWKEPTRTCPSND